MPPATAPPRGGCLVWKLVPVLNHKNYEACNTVHPDMQMEYKYCRSMEATCDTLNVHERFLDHCYEDAF